MPVRKTASIEIATINYDWPALSLIDGANDIVGDNDYQIIITPRYNSEIIANEQSLLNLINNSIFIQRNRNLNASGQNNLSIDFINTIDLSTSRFILVDSLDNIFTDTNSNDLWLELDINYQGSLNEINLTDDADNSLEDLRI